MREPPTGEREDALPHVPPRPSTCRTSRTRTKPGATVRQEKVDELLAGNGFDVEKYNKAFPLASVEGGMLLDGNKPPTLVHELCKERARRDREEEPEGDASARSARCSVPRGKLTDAQQNKYWRTAAWSSAAADDEDDEDDESEDEEEDDDDEMEEEGEGEGEDAAEERDLDLFLGQAMQGAEDEEEPEEEERDEFYKYLDNRRRRRRRRRRQGQQEGGQARRRARLPSTASAARDASGRRLPRRPAAPPLPQHAPRTKTIRTATATAATARPTAATAATTVRRMRERGRCAACERPVRGPG